MVQNFALIITNGILKWKENKMGIPLEKIDGDSLSIKDSGNMYVNRPQRITLRNVKSQIDTTILGLDNINTEYKQDAKYIGQAIIYLKMLHDLIDDPEGE